VLSLTHDRWFMRNFDRFLVFHEDGSVTQSLVPELTLERAKTRSITT